MIRILDTNLNFVDYMRKYTFSQYTVKFRGIGEFKVNAQLVPENLYLLDKTKQFFILFSGKTDEQFGIIESAEKTSDSETEQTLVLSGRMANAILDKRVIYRTVKFRGKTHDFVKTVIEDNLILSEDESRNMNINLTLSDKMLMEQTGTTISKQVTGGYLWDAIEPILEVDALGVKFVPVVKPKQNADDINIDEWSMVIVKGTDRRKGNQDLRPPVVFSQSVSNIKQTEYRTSVRDYRNFVYIAGEGAAGERKWYTKEINSSDSKGNTGWNRSELWIDARDIQSEDAEGNTIPEEQYEQLIDERIDEKAEEASVVENYDSTIVQENKLYVYGEDYFLGDFVTVIDKELNITIDVQITEVTVSEQDAQTIFDIGLTYGAIKRDLVQQISINKKTSTGNENSIRYLEAQIKKISSGGGGSEYYDFVGTNEELQQAIADGTVTAGMKTWVTDDPEDGEVISEQVYEPNRVMVTDEEGKAQSSNVINVELDGLSGVTENIQAQFNILKENPLSHNKIYRGKDITSYYNDGSLYTRISNGTFEDIYLGDYFVDSKNVTWIVAGFDLFLNIGDTGLVSHHIVIVPKTILGTSYMNSTNTAVGGYKGSYMFTTKLPEIMATYITPAFGSHALSHRVLISNDVNATADSNAGAGLAGCSNSWEWASVVADLMSEINVYGSVVCSSSFYDIGNKNMRFPLFDFDNQAVFAYRNWYWLCAVASATYFCYAVYDGYPYCNVASLAAGGVRPYLLIG